MGHQSKRKDGANCQVDFQVWRRERSFREEHSIRHRLQAAIQENNAETQGSRPKKLFTAQEVRLILDALEGKEATVTESGKPAKVKVAANPQLRAMVLLALNGGVRNTDIGNLEFAHVSQS